ncbi:MAG: hypothetical protein B6I26_02025 [Desulfobacteraceae bacterium 4572_130]|nr:MAG: hypothetical protein B6I26_02025 [Desulfobacteraceae bacterium 4572_130]
MKYILVCDLDDTLTGDKNGIIEFNKTISFNRKFFYLVYSSGRFKDSIISLIKAQNLISPNAIISNVGTEIYYDPGWNIDEKWENIVKNNWVNIKKYVLRALDKFDLHNQPYNKKFVIPYYIEDKVMVNKIKKALERLEIKIIWTRNRCIDILPQNAGKGNSAKYIGEKLNLPIICCGDSENDIDMLKQSKYGILVGNASNDLKNKLFNHGNIYIATSYYAKGVIEGLKYYNIYMKEY